MAIGIAPAGDSGRPPVISGALHGLGGLCTSAAKARIGDGQFLGEVTRGYEVDWLDCHVLPNQADCVQAALGLLHMRVKCMIPKELGGNYVPEVSGMCVGFHHLEVSTDTHWSSPCANALVGNGRDIGRAVCLPSGGGLL